MDRNPINKSMTGHKTGHFIAVPFEWSNNIKNCSFSGQLPLFNQCDLAVKVMCCYIYRSAR
jgi:hypothetical protein